MKIPVDRLFGADVEAIEVNETLRLPGNLGERYPDGVRVSATVEHISRGVYMEGSLEGSEVETCVRCLEQFQRPAKVAIAEAFSEDVSPEDAVTSDVTPLIDRTIDLDDLVAQLLEVDEPIAAVCSPDCKGICPICGANRNVMACTCEEHLVDGRTAGLARRLQERGRN